MTALTGKEWGSGRHRTTGVDRSGTKSGYTSIYKNIYARASRRNWREKECEDTDLGRFVQKINRK